MPSMFDVLSMNLPLAAAVAVPRWCIGLVIAAVGIALLMPYATKAGRAVGAGLSAIGVGVIFASLPWEASVLTRGLFYVLTAITLISAVGAVASRAAIYCAVWFAASLLGVSGLLVLAGAQFLGIATIVVYAGAIVVTFLFVIMLAQPRGNESYDRVSWGSLSKPVAVFAAAALVAASFFSQQSIATGSLREEVADLLASIPASGQHPAITQADVVAVMWFKEDPNPALRITLRPTIFPVLPTHASQASEQAKLDAKLKERSDKEAALVKAFSAAADEVGLEDFDPASTKIAFVSALPINDVLTTRHVEALGVNLFGNQLVAVQVAGVLLLVALVGAISILTHDAPVQPRSEAAI
jgi:NADH-quinone oxidoreductase subunit J